MAGDSTVSKIDIGIFLEGRLANFGDFGFFEI